MQAALFFRRLDSVFSLVTVVGKDGLRFLSGLLTCDLRNLAAGHGAYGALLTVKGKVVTDLIVLCRGPHEQWLLLPARLCQKVLDLLDRYIVGDDVTLAHDLGPRVHLGIYGAVPDTLLPTPPGPYRHVDHADLTVAATQELGHPSIHVIGSLSAIEALQDRLTQAGASRLSQEQAQAWRIEAGRPQAGVDFDEDRFPQEAGLLDALAFQKGCFLGQEVVVRLRDRGKLHRKLVGLRLSGPAFPAAGAALLDDAGKKVGELTSVARSARFSAIALGYVEMAHAQPGQTLTVNAETDPGAQSTATVSALPFQ